MYQQYSKMPWRPGPPLLLGAQGSGHRTPGQEGLDGPGGWPLWQTQNQAQAQSLKHSKCHGYRTRFRAGCRLRGPSTPTQASLGGWEKQQHRV